MGSDCQSPFANDSTSQPTPELGHYGTLSTTKEEILAFYDECDSGYWNDCLCLDVGNNGLLKNGMIGEITASDGGNCMGILHTINNSREYHTYCETWC
jgi:hypothetical protein